MRLGLIVNTDDAEDAWNAFRLGNNSLEKGNEVEAFLLGDGVYAPDLDHEKCNPAGAMRKFLDSGGKLNACGTCMDSRDLDATELRPRGTMDDLQGLTANADTVVTI